MPRNRCLELKSLKEYLFSYRNLGIFQENIVNQVLEDVAKACDPVWAIVEGVPPPRRHSDNGRSPLAKTHHLGCKFEFRGHSRRCETPAESIHPTPKCERMSYDAVLVMPMTLMSSS